LAHAVIDCLLACPCCLYTCSPAI